MQESVEAVLRRELEIKHPAPPAPRPKSDPLGGVVRTLSQERVAQQV